MTSKSAFTASDPVSGGTSYTIQLGHVGPEPGSGTTSHRGRLIYWAALDAVLLVECRDADAWRCGIVARRRGPCLPDPVAVTDADVAAAPTTLTTDPDTDPDGFALLWKAQVFLHSPAGRTPSFARKLADLVRTPGTVTITLGPSTLDTISRSVHLHPVTLRRMVERLVGAQLLTRHPPPAPDLLTYTLALPGIATSTASRS